MNNPDAGFEGIADITAPLLPPETGMDPVLVTVLVSLLLLVVTIVIAWRARRRPLPRARRQLAELQAAYRLKRIGKRETSYRIAAIMCSGLQLVAINTSTRLPLRLATQQPRWNNFVTQLAQARYTRTSCDDQQLEALFRHAQFWLRQWS